MTTVQSSTTTVQITHVRMVPGGTHHEHIESVKWRMTSSGRVDVSTVASMVTFIDGGGSAVTWDGRSSARVIVVRPAGHAPYIRTVADGVLTDNLLQLPRF